MIVVLCAVDLWWLWRFRAGYPLHIDEATYLRIAFENTDALRSGGLSALASTFAGQSAHAPLTSLATVPAHLALGRTVMSSFVVQSGFFALLVVSTYGVARRLAPPGVAALSAFAVAAMPGVIDYTRSYFFVPASTALFVAATYALLRSEGLERRGWACLWGFLMGATLLARTIMVAFVPGLIAAAAVALLVRPGSRARRLGNLALAVGTAAITAATWYGPNLSSVTAYLTGFGYGPQSAHFGESRSPLRPEYWLTEVTLALKEGLYLPLGILLFGGLAAGAVVVARRLRSAGDRRATAAQMIGSDAFLLALPLVSGYLALTSTANDGNGFSVPLLPALAVLGLAPLTLVRRPRVKAALVATVIAAGLLNVVSKADVLPALSGTHGVTLPFSATIPIVDGRGRMQRYVVESGYPVDPVTSPLSEAQRRWVPFAAALARDLDAYAAERGTTPAVLFGTRHRMFNASSLRLGARMAVGESPRAAVLDPLWMPDTVEAYRRSLRTPPSSPPNVLITGARSPAEYTPVANGARVERAARLEGFRRIRSLRLPDGTPAEIWWADQLPTGRSARRSRHAPAAVAHSPAQTSGESSR